MIWVFVKVFQTHFYVNCLRYQQQSSSFTRVLQNTRFQHSDTSHHNNVGYFTRCLAICNLKEKCDSVNYNARLMKCLVHRGVTESMRMDEHRMLEEDGWTYYEKNKQNMVCIIYFIADAKRHRLTFAIPFSLQNLTRFCHVLFVLICTKQENEIAKRCLFFKTSFVLGQ